MAARPENGPFSYAVGHTKLRLVIRNASPRDALTTEKWTKDRSVGQGAVEAVQQVLKRSWV